MGKHTCESRNGAEEISMAPVLTCKFMKHSIFKKRTENSRCLLVALCHAGAGGAGWPGVEGFGKFHPKGHTAQGPCLALTPFVLCSQQAGRALCWSYLLRERRKAEWVISGVGKGSRTRKAASGLTCPHQSKKLVSRQRLEALLDPGVIWQTEHAPNKALGIQTGWERRRL